MTATRPSRQTISMLLWISRRKAQLIEERQDVSRIKLGDLLAFSLPLILLAAGISTRTSEAGSFVKLGNREISMSLPLLEAEKILLKDTELFLERE